jgi:UDP:flavonoid glycosyltransferase YjiC (YdhE family)
MSTIAFFPEGAYGPTNNCVGIGDVLRGRGHRVAFIVEESFAGTLEAQGFEERLMRLGPPPEVEEAPGQFWKDFIRDTAPVFRRPTIEQLEAFIAPTFQALCDGARYVDDRLHEIIDELQPDVIVEDNVVGFPALAASGRPWVRIASCNPAELKDPAVPPTFSGYSARDRSGWPEYWEEYKRTLGDLAGSFSEFFLERGAPALPELELIDDSPWEVDLQLRALGRRRGAALRGRGHCDRDRRRARPGALGRPLNLCMYPREVDYERELPLGETWQNLEANGRATDAPWEASPGDGALVYLSLGSLGSADVGLMRRLIATLAETPHRVVVSMGPQHAELELADNMVGAEFLPQTSILPQVDAVITHGGNNTVTECLYFERPMVVLPLFWDQYDNAQRIEETGFGIRLDTYGHEPAELVSALDRLLAAPRDRWDVVARRLQGAPGTRRAADLITAAAARPAPQPQAP